LCHLGAKTKIWYFHLNLDEIVHYY
jgi:hypothetical protein